MAVGNIAITGLLGGTAGKIDTDALIKALMAANSMPKQQLQIRVGEQQKVTQAYQGINSTMAAITSAADKLRDSDSWLATKATSSSSKVSASSTATADVGSTTFKVDQLASVQISTLTADADGNWVGDYTNGITIQVGDGEATTVALESGSVDDIAKAINGTSGLGVRAAVITVDDADGGTQKMLQLTGAKTGVANAFTVTGTTSEAQTLQGALDAKVSVGDPEAGGYSISSSTNTFVDAMPGVTFTLGTDSLDEKVTIRVASDSAKIANLVKSLTDSVNSARLAIDTYTGKGAVLQGDSTVTSLVQDMSYVFTSATADGKSLTSYGIDITKDGLTTFDADVFSAAYAADPEGTMQAIADSVANPLKRISEASSAPITGTISQLITSGNNRVTDLNKQIDSMQERLDKVQEQLQTKYLAMQTALASLQSKGDWLTSMFESMNKKDD